MVDDADKNKGEGTSTESGLTAEQIKAFKERQKIEDEPWGLCSLGEDIAQYGDKKWATSIYQQALDKVEDDRDFIHIAESVADEKHLGDKEWARQIYRQALDKADDVEDLTYTAASLADEGYLDDKEWARKVYQQALEKSEYIADFKNIAASVEDEGSINDKDWAQKIYQQAFDLEKNLPQTIPIGVLEKWLSELKDNLQEYLESIRMKMKNDKEKRSPDSRYFRAKGMIETVDQVSSKIRTWIEHQEKKAALVQSGQRLLIVRDDEITQGMLKKLKWYEFDQSISLAFRWGMSEKHPSIDIDIHNIEDLSNRVLIYHGESSYKELVERVREGGLPSILNEETEKYWVEMT